MNPPATPGSQPGRDATKKLPGEGFERPWLLLICMNGEVHQRIASLLKNFR